MNYWLLSIPFIAAIVGWVIHSSALKLVFHPCKPTRILGIFFQGLLPKKQEQIARGIGQSAARAFSFSSIDEKINDPRHLEKIKPVIEKQVDEFLRVKLGKEMPMISMFIGDKTIESLKKVFMQELETLFPQVIGQFAENIRAELDVEKLVINKITSIPPGQLEELIYKGMSKEFRAFKRLGALTGFIIGVITVIITFLLS